MHWTAFLAYRRFPAHARVMEDCACIQCGYNLRMQMVSARCPECGHEVGNSVFLLARPSVASRGLRTAAMTYLAPLAIALPAIFETYWSAFIVALAGTAAALFRFIGTSDLRFNAAIVRLPIVGSRLMFWWIAATIDLVVASGFLVSMLLVSANRNLRASGLGYSIITWCFIGWWFMTILSAWLAGRFGFALMDMLNYVWTRIEFRIQQIAVLVVFALGPAFLIGLKSVASPMTLNIIEIAIAVITSVAMIMTTLPVLHAATACDESTADWDELIATERIAVVPESQRPHKPEPPPIKVER